MQRNGVLECSVCRPRVAVPSPRSMPRAYDKHRNKISHMYRALNFLLVSGDCILAGFQVTHFLACYDYDLNPNQETFSSLDGIEFGGIHAGKV
jgi:hypothetical protein